MTTEEDLQRQWLPAAVLAALVYTGVGVAFGALAGSSATNEMRIFWRLGAWLVSALVFAAHVWRENVRMKYAPRISAWHAAAACAWGAFGLAIAANLHEMLGTHQHRLMVILSLVIWPILTCVPAYIVALVLAVALKRISRTPSESSHT